VASALVFEVMNNNACVYSLGVCRVYVHSTTPFIWR